MDSIFFNNWESIIRIFIVTISAYFLMVFFLRISGKRTLSKMKAFDFIVTIALGSSLATVALNKNVPLAKGALVFFLLILMQFFITWLSVRVKKIKKIITSEAVLLLYKGEVLNNILTQKRITIEEIYLAAREKGITSLSNIDAVILETTDDITVVPEISSSGKETMKDVQNYS